jgi:hypothetical protein
MSSDSGLIQFKLNLTISGGYISKPAESVIEYAMPELADICAKIVLRDPAEVEARTGHRLAGYVLAERRVSSDMEEFVRAFIDRRLIARADGID